MGRGISPESVDISSNAGSPFLFGSSPMAIRLFRQPSSLTFFMYSKLRLWRASSSSRIFMRSARSASTPPETKASAHRLSFSKTGLSSRYLRLGIMAMSFFL